MLDLLQSASNEHALRLLRHLRSGRSIRSVIDTGAALPATSAGSQDGNEDERDTSLNSAAVPALLASDTRPTTGLTNLHKSQASRQTSYIPNPTRNKPIESRVLPSLQPLG